MNPPIGILVNPRSGGDLRRAVAAAGRSSITDKVSVVRRLVLGAVAAGCRDIVVNYDPHQIVRKATENIADVNLTWVTPDLLFTEEDSTRAAIAMREAGCAAVAVLGGDGTNRAVAKGWPDIPVIAVSTGTNNAFPEFIEPTVAGTSLALISQGVVSLPEVSQTAKLLHLTIDDDAGKHFDEPDIALIDAVAVADRYVGSMELFEPDTMRMAVLTRADPAAIGFSALGGLLSPVSASDDAALLIRFAPVTGHDGVVVRAPMAPGHYDNVGIAEVRRLALGESVEARGPFLLAFDGERKRRVSETQTARFEVRRDGPTVIDPQAVMAQGRGHFVAQP